MALYRTPSPVVRVRSREDFCTAVALGNVSGITPLNKFGQSDNVESGERTMMPMDDAYVWPATANHGVVQVSSSASADLGQKVRIYGLAATTYLLQDEEVTLDASDAQTGVDSVGSYARIFRAKTSDDAGSEMAGTVYVSKTGASLTNGVPGTADLWNLYTADAQQTLFAGYTVPAATTLLINHLRITTNTAANLTFKVRIRELGKVATLLEQFTSSTPVMAERWYCPALIIPAKADVWIAGLSATGSQTASGGFGGYLVAD